MGLGVMSGAKEGVPVAGLAAFVRFIIIDLHLLRIRMSLSKIQFFILDLFSTLATTTTIELIHLGRTPPKPNMAAMITTAAEPKGSQNQTSEVPGCSKSTP